MNGPEHYAEADRLLALAEAVAVIEVPHEITMDEAEGIKARFEEHVGVKPLVVSQGARVDLSGVFASAQVHATLALAAATAADRWVSPVRDYGGQDVVTGQGWAEVTR